MTLWNVATGRQLLDLKSGCTHLMDVEFSPDGRQLSASGHNTLGESEILLWSAAAVQEH